MINEKIVIIDYGAGNVQSVRFAFERLGVLPVLSRDWDEIKNADRVIFPGVGEAAWAMSSLQKDNLHLLIPQLKQPVLGICLGMQLMCASSQEGKTRGLGIFPGEAQRFAPVGKVPHMGWNQLEGMRGPLFEGIAPNSYVYFVHSYYVPIMDQTSASCEYINSFSAAMQKDNFFACQFHPEKSGEVGAKILQNFLDC